MTWPIPRGQGGSEEVQVVDTSDDLAAIPGPEGTIGVVLGALANEPSLYVRTASAGWKPVASLAGATLPAAGAHNLMSATHPDVAGALVDGYVLVWRYGPD